MDIDVSEGSPLSNMEDGKPEAMLSNDISMQKKSPKKVYIPGHSRKLKPGEELSCDESAYLLYQRFNAVHPCLSFDIVLDSLGDKRERFPMTCYIVAGTQAENSRDNSVVLMKLDNLHENRKAHNDDSESESSSEEEDAEVKTPIFRSALISHHGGINRLRACQMETALVCATWNENGKVHIWNLASALRTVDSPESKIKTELKAEKPLFTFSGHQIEGFALDWSPVAVGRLATGDCRRNIYVWNMKEGGQWSVNQKPFNSHTASVEDIQWSPTEPVFASCSSDKSIRLWDARVSPQQACFCTVNDAHCADVNVISWNKLEPLLVSGGDDHILKIWDLRMLQVSKNCIASFRHHLGPITSVQWSPNDSTTFAATGEDNQLTIWDVAVEADPEEIEIDEAQISVSPNLLFIHQGQQEMKELRWHPQLPGVIISTALDDFNIFKTVNV